MWMRLTALCVLAATALAKGKPSAGDPWPTLCDAWLCKQALEAHALLTSSKARRGIAPFWRDTPTAAVSSATRADCTQQ